MTTPTRPPAPARPWHALFAPLPAEAVPVKRPIAPSEILSTPAGAAIAGWTQLTVELTAGCAGLRTVMVALDATGTPISASDGVVTRTEIDTSADADASAGSDRTSLEWIHESVGGRLEADGTFRGTRWHTLMVEDAEGRETTKVSTPAEPTAQDEAELKALVAEMLRRASV